MSVLEHSNILNIYILTYIMYIYLIYFSILLSTPVIVMKTSHVCFYFLNEPPQSCKIDNIIYVWRIQKSLCGVKKPFSCKLSLSRHKIGICRKWKVIQTKISAEGNHSHFIFTFILAFLNHLYTEHISKEKTIGSWNKGFF